MTRNALALSLVLWLTLSAAVAGTPQSPNGPFTTREGTWLPLDVAPDGRTIAFGGTLLGVRLSSVSGTLLSGECRDHGRSQRRCAILWHRRSEVVRESISISLPEALKVELDEAVQAEGVSRSDVVREALREYLFVRRFRELRRELMPYAEARGIFTDDDVFREAS